MIRNVLLRQLDSDCRYAMFAILVNMLFQGGYRFTIHYTIYTVRSIILLTRIDGALSDPRSKI